MNDNPLFDKKVEYWKANLIDLSKKNRLLNFRETKTGSIKLIHPKPEDLFDILFQKGREMTFKWQENIFNEIQEMPLSEIDYGRYRLNQSDLITPKNESDQNRAVNTLRLRWRTAFHEQGVNLLYVTFGMLHWNEADSSDKTIKSPLFLVPVKIRRESINEPFKLKILEDEIIFNPTLLQKLANDFNLTLPELPDNLDDFKLVDQYKKIEAKITKLSGWKISNEVHLGLFSFKKFIMYNDLMKYYNHLENHPIICALAGDRSKLPQIPSDLPTAEELDNEVTPEDTYQVLDADSSQQEAIIAAKRGMSFVIQGPPGTGKSQTISNIIAECLEADKTVLFVSEKMAALEVVKKRLDAHNLGEFCLELHSHKANKKQVMTELGNTLDTRINKQKVSSQKIQKLSELKKLRKILNAYVQALHKKRTRLNVSAYHVHGKLAALETAPDIRFKVPNIANLNDESIETIDTLLDRLTSMDHVFDNHAQHPWNGCNLSQYSFEVQNSVMDNFSKFKESLQNVEQKCQILAQLMAYSSPKNLSVCERLCRWGNHLSSSPIPPESWLNNQDLNLIGETALRAENLHSKYQKGRENILSKYDEKVYGLNIQKLHAMFINEYDSFFRIFKGSYRADMKQLSGLFKGGKLDYKITITTLAEIKNSIQLKSEIDDNQTKYRNIFGHYYKGLKTDWSQVASALEWTNELYELFSNKSVPDKLVEIATVDNESREKIINFKPDKMNEYINTELIKQYELIKTIFNDK
ncbi:MAG: DUF4011 domain-containing protein, partial [Candidatus Heimdallarchaeota archaeon]|nr:DUF4011 domain-containing protein [Candidatus Heimdallarchaeota archaeon]